MKKKNRVRIWTIILSLSLCVSPCSGVFSTMDSNVSTVSAMTSDPYAFYWNASLGNQGYGVVQEDANIYWCSRGNVSPSTYIYRYDNVGWHVQIRSAAGQEIVLYLDDDSSVYGTQREVGGYYYTIQYLPSSVVFEAILDSQYDYTQFCSGPITVEFDGHVKLYKSGASTYGPYDLRNDGELNTLLYYMSVLSFSSASKTAVTEQFRNKMIHISGETVLEKHTHSLDIEGMINGNVQDDIEGYGVVDVYINDSLVEEAISDYKEMYLDEITYEMSNLQIAEGYHNVGDEVFTGNLTQDTAISIAINSNVAYVSYYTNGGDIESDTYKEAMGTELIVNSEGDDYLQQLIFGENIQLLRPDELGLGKTGYTMMGWNTPIGTVYEAGQSYTAEDFIDENGNTVRESHGGQVYMYAQWEANKYKIEYDSNGGTGEGIEVQEAKYDEEVQLEKNTYKYEGHAFVGWNTEKDGTGASYDDEEIVKNLTDEVDKTVVLYAMWDEAPNIEAHDIYVTAHEVEIGKVTESYLMEFAEATDQEDGTLYKEKNYSIGEEKETSFYLLDYQESDFQGISNGMVSITYKAVDSRGNHVEEMSNVYIVDDTLSIPEEKGLRFISEEYRDTLAENSIWNIEESYREVLESTLSNMKHKRDTEKEVESGWGYVTKKPGSGTFEKEPMQSWLLDSNEIQFIQDSIIKNGFSYEN